MLLHCIYEGSDSAVEWLKSHRALIKSLCEFRYADERNIDQGGPSMYRGSGKIYVVVLLLIICVSFTFTVRTKAQLLTDMVKSPEKMEAEKQKYSLIRAQMGRPGIVDMNGGDTPRELNFRKNSRMTLDIQDTSRGSFSRSASGASPITASATGGGLSSPRRSLENNSNKKLVQQRPSLALEGRYSLSIPLQAIQE